MSLSRRQLLRTSAVGFGYLALASLLADEASAEPVGGRIENPSYGPLAPRRPHFATRAKRVIFLFMKGGPSHVDTFDYKPLLDRDDGKPLPFAKPRVQFAADRQPARARPGSSSSTARAASGSASCSRTWPSCVDDLCFIHSRARHQPGPRRRAAQAAHRQRQLRPAQHGLVGHLRPGHREPEPARLHHHLPDAGPRRRQQLGLGLPARRLPGHAARQRQRPGRPGPRSATSRNAAPAARRAAAAARPAGRDEPRAPGRSRARPGARRRASTRSSWPSACRPTMPEVEDLSGEIAGDAASSTASTTRSTANFGRQCLLARRFAERGVRFVQVTHSDANVQWDQHGDLQEGPREERPRGRPADRRPAART